MSLLHISFTAAQSEGKMIRQPTQNMPKVKQDFWNYFISILYPTTVNIKVYL